MNDPRTKDTQKTPSRPARAHHNKQRSAGRFTINGQDLEKHFAEYVTVCFPDTPRDARERFTKVLMYAAQHNKPIPSPNEMNNLFEDEIVTPSEIPLNPRQNG